MQRRDLLVLIATASIAPLARAGSLAERADVLVTTRPRAGSRIPAFASLGDALAAAPGGDAPYRVGIDAGTWHEKITIDRANVHLIGAGRARSTLRFDAAAGDRDAQGELWGTWGCASLRVCAPGFRARALTIANGFDYLAHLRAPRLETIGANGAQAVALMLDVGSEDARIEDCDLIGHQDTVFVDAGRSRFDACTIRGSVDFVFGAGQALFSCCTLVSRQRPGKPRQGYVAAPSTSLAAASGLVFHRCRLLAERGVPAATVALGRPWRPTRTFADGRYGDPDAVGAAAFIACTLGAHIAAEGWDAMNTTARDGTRVALEPSAARFAEHANSGPGARWHVARQQLSAQQARALLDAAGADSFAGVAGAER
jgi:pectinesterase